LGDLPNLLAAELGVMTVRLESAIRSLDGVARVHVNRWGDGAAHLHLWFLARPLGRLQLRGTFLSLWDDILPVIPESQWRRNLAHIGAWLAEFGGRSYAETPRIDWQTPLSIDGLARGTTWASIVEPPAESDSTAESASAATSDLSGSAVSGPADAVEPKDADTPAVVDPTVVPDMLAADVTVKADLAETDLAEPGLAETDATGVPIAVAAPEARSRPTRRETKGQRHRLAPDSGDPDELWLDGDGPSWT